MKVLLNLFFVIFFAGLLQSCTKTESDFSTDQNLPESISISASTINTSVNVPVLFSVISSRGINVTDQSKIYINGNLVTGNSFTFTQSGNYAVYATKGSLNSPVITINVTVLPSTSVNFKHKVLVEEYSGTWCGNCPRILYGVDLLHQQTTNAIVVSTHLFGSDPFISTDGNNLAAQQGVSGVPAGRINRVTNWTGPQYDNVNQVINTIQASASTGLAINSVVVANSLNVTVKVRHEQPVTGNAKLTVYLVEDKLYHSQSNYSANLYNGLSTIPNFEYNGVLRKIISNLAGDNIPSSGTNIEKSYTLNLPANISNISNAKIVAFVTDDSGNVINVQQVKAGENKGFEIL